MLKATKRTYRWTYFKADYDELKRSAEAVYDPKCEYCPLVQAYFELLPEHASFENLEVFKNSRAFSCFQNELIEEHESFLDKFSSNNRCNRNNLKEYFNNLVSVHDKFHRTLILSGFCLLKIAKISLNSSFFPKPIKR